MSKKHAFEPGVIVVRRLGQAIRSLSHCQTCGKAGEKRVIVRGGRTVTYWQHTARPDVEPAPRVDCDWRGTGGIWCCKTQGHAGGHHAHRGQRRDVDH